MANSKNTQILLISAKQVFPTATYSTGTATTTAADPRVVVLGGGGVTTSMQPGGWIYNAAQTEVHQIELIISSTQLLLREAFGAVLAGVAYTYSPPSRYREVSWLVNSTGNAAIDGVTVAANDYGSWGKASGGIKSTSGSDFIDAIIFDGSVTPIKVTSLR